MNKKSIPTFHCKGFCPTVFTISLAVLKLGANSKLTIPKGLTLLIKPIPIQRITTIITTVANAAITIFFVMLQRNKKTPNLCWSFQLII